MRRQSDQPLTKSRDQRKEMGVRKRHTGNCPQGKIERLFEEAKRWSIDWGLSRLMRDVTVEFSNDIGLALGRCDLKRMTVTLNGLLLLEENETLLFETFCHELAHVVAAVRYGCGIEEHGSEWAEYMQKAGFAPRPFIPESLIVCG